MFIDSIPKVNELLYSMTTCHLLDFPDKPIDLSGYFENQKQQRTQAKKDFENVIEKLIGECEGVCQNVRDSAILPELEDLDPARIGQRNKKKSMVQQKLEEKERKHKIQLAEEHRSMLGHYIRLADYMSIETLVSLILDRTKKFYQNLMEKKAKIFTTKVSYGKEKIIFEPNEEEFKEKFDAILDTMVSDINGITRLTFRFDEVLASDRLTSPPQLSEIIKHSDVFRETSKKIIEKFHDDFIEAQLYTETSFEKARHVNDYVESWNFETYKSEGHTVQHIKDELNKIREWNQKEIVNYVPSSVSSVKGILNIDGKGIKGHLTTVLATAQQDLKNYLNTMAFNKADQANQLLKDINARLVQQPAPLSDFIKFMEDLNQSKIEIQKIEASKSELDEIEKALKKEKFNHDTTATTVKFGELEKSCKDCRVNIDLASEFIEKKKGDMEKRLATRVEKLKTLLSEDLNKRLDESAIISVDAHPTEALNELKKIEAKLKKGEKNAEKYKHYQEVFSVGVTRIKELEDTSYKFKTKSKL